MDEGEIVTNYTSNYSKTRGWDKYELVREFYQNALDATAPVGEPIIGVTSKITSNGLEITDNGRGFNVLSLLMGQTSKSVCDRGRFGEGMKIACLTALTMGYQVEILTDSVRIIPQFKKIVVEDDITGKDIEAEILVFKYTKVPRVEGTKILVRGSSGRDAIIANGYSDLSTYDYRFNIETNKNIILKAYISTCGGKEYPSYIINEPIHCLYVRNIFVQNIETEESLYSYDLFDVTVSTDRNIPSTSDVMSQIGRLWSCVKDPEMIRALLIHIKAEGYEKEIRIRQSVIEEKGSTEAWKKGFYAAHGENAFISTSDEATKLAQYLLKFHKHGVQLPYGIRSVLNSIGIESDADIIEMYKSVAPSSPDTIDDVQKDNFEYLNMIHYKLKEYYYPNLKRVFIASKESMFDSQGKVIRNFIYIREDMLNNMVTAIDVYGHECTHVVYPELYDNTSDFYSKIGLVMATITKVIFEYHDKFKMPKNVKW